MLHLDMTILYVGSPTRSAEFYTDITGCEPIESSPNFAMFELENGARLGLWKSEDVEPHVAFRTPAAGEVCFAVKSADAVRAIHAEWATRMPIAQPPVEMDFGHTFVGLDPDGHRLRVFAPAMR